MTENKISIGIVCVFVFTLFFADIGNTDSSAQWILYGTSEMGDSYYNKSSITEVSPKIIQLWNKDKYSEIGKNLIIQGRINYNLPVDGYDKLDYVTDILELDCVNKTIKDIFFVEYNDKDEVLFEFDIPNPKVSQAAPSSIQETLLKKICL